MTLMYPYALYLLFLLPFLALYEWRKGQQEAVLYSSLSLLKKTHKTWRQRLLWLPKFLQYLALILIIFCLARPQLEVDNAREDREGIAIEIVFDISSSMSFSMDYDGERTSRMKVAKKVVRDFIVGNDKDLKGRPDDLIGLITFARYADTISPMTQNHEALVGMVDDLTTNDRPNEDGTAYGDATSLAAARLQALSQRKETVDINSKVLILLTDGQNNSGKFQPLQAAAFAKKWGIKIYTISIQERNDNERIYRSGKKSVDTLASLSPSDEILQRMAEMTGGLFRSAYDYDSLKKVYEEIDVLEKSKLKMTVFKEKDEAFVNYLIAALLLLVTQAWLNATLLRAVR